MDCPICYNIIQCSAIGSCTHHFCYDCILQWCEFGGINCPICQTQITQISRDIEFDTINGIAATSPKKMHSMQNNVIVNFEKNDIAGITLENNYSTRGFSRRGPGVTISKINDKSRCYKNGLRKNDIIIAVNNIPCTDHSQTIKIIDCCVLACRRINCSLLKTRRDIQ
jgi:hypothetical protein